ncbi:MAG: hypothetical protein LIO94_04730 [Clostridiales bacterium]|nr:hypothetical protein [Clostridiales bacterium]
MAGDCKKCRDNIYFACREKAAKYNEKLSSRESAAELLGISTSTLANHELGVHCILKAVKGIAGTAGT